MCVKRGVPDLLRVFVLSLNSSLLRAIHHAVALVFTFELLDDAALNIIPIICVVLMGIGVSFTAVSFLRLKAGFDEALCGTGFMFFFFFFCPVVNINARALFIPRGRRR